MDSTNDKDGAEHVSELHKLLGVTPAQVRQEMIDEGLDPEAEIAAMRRLGRVLAAKYADQIERETRMPTAIGKPFPFFAEAAAAGSPAWIAGAEPHGEASLLDVLSKGDSDDTMWARVRGWSMKDEGINDGDLVLVNTKREPNDGDIVLAHLAGEGEVVKRLRKRNSAVFLESANADFAPMEVPDASALRIHGVVVGRAGRLTR